MRAGALPALARLTEEGTLHTITTAFPSVTGPAYTPFLTGRHPGSVGLPGLRWFDRARDATGWPANARSYVGVEMRRVDRDLAPESRTMFELADPSLGALSVIGRGLAPRARSGPSVAAPPRLGARIGRGAGFVLRTALTHFRGDVRGWLALDRMIADQIAHRVRSERPAYVFAALTGIDKTSHAVGHDSALTREAMQIVDDLVARLRADAERDGRWETMQLWVVSDHGHSPVREHDDLAALVASMGFRVLAHPRVLARAPQVAVMVSGNAMAHLYFELERRERPFWDALAPRYDAVIDEIIARPSGDLAILPRSATVCEIRSHRGGVARLCTDGRRYSYRPLTGDPLGIGEQDAVDERTAYEVTFDSEYPDALVQIARIIACERSGDVILSAARDLRARYEPIPHRSTHGALHREHMLVPLLTNRRVRGTPRRTVDVMPSAARVLGVDPGTVEGVSFA